MLNKLMIALVLLTSLAAGQTSDYVLKPEYVLIGTAYNQFSGPSMFVTGIIPEVASKGLFASASLDMVPQKYVDPKGKTGYLVAGAVRFGQHMQVFKLANNVLTLGADLGPTFSQNAVPTPAENSNGNGVLNIGGTAIGLSSSFTVSYSRMFSDKLGITVPVKMLWLSGVGPNGQGAWNPVFGLALLLKP